MADSIAIAGSDDEEQVKNLKEISTTKMGETSIKYSSDPRNILGNGLDTFVYPGYHFGINKPAAVKYIKEESLRVEKDEVNELKIWSEVDQNVNIVRLYDSHRDPKGGLYLAMELAERTFRKQIIQFNPNRDEIITWIYQVSKAVEYLHSKGVIHRDIKPDNILMFLQNGNKTVAKLADFGVSKMISGLERTGTVSNASGTISWMAPEAYENRTKNTKFKNTKSLDIFALGMTIYFGLSKGGHPFTLKEKSDKEENYLISLFPVMPDPFAISKKLSADQVAANDLLKDMMEREPDNRPKISQVLSHCFFWNWEQEQLFLIRVAICLSKRDSLEINAIKEMIDKRYKQHFHNIHPSQTFNWNTIGWENGVNIPELLFNTRKRKYCAHEYGSGESVTSFLRFFRDKYVHYPEMTPNGAILFSDNDGSFCEESYVRILTSACPNLSAVLYQMLSQYANLDSLHPLRKLYFPWKLRYNQTENRERLAVSCMTDYTVDATIDIGFSQSFENIFVDFEQPKRRMNWMEEDESNE